MHPCKERSMDPSPLIHRICGSMDQWTMDPWIHGSLPVRTGSASDRFRFGPGPVPTVLLPIVSGSQIRICCPVSVPAIPVLKWVPPVVLGIGSGFQFLVRFGPFMFIKKPCRISPWMRRSRDSQRFPSPDIPTDALMSHGVCWWVASSQMMTARTVL